MKKTLLFISALVAGSTGFAQTELPVPNGGFESWTYTSAPSSNLNNWSDSMTTVITSTLNGTPNGTTTTHYRIADSITTSPYEGTKSIVVHSNVNSGAAVPGAMISGNNATFIIASKLNITAPPIPPIISSVGTPTVTTYGNIPIGSSARVPYGLKGYYKYKSDSASLKGATNILLFANGDTVAAYADITKLSSATTANDSADALIYPLSPTNSWTAFSLVVTANILGGYTSIPSVVDSARVIFLTCTPGQLLTGKSSTHDSLFLDKLEFIYAPATPVITLSGSTLTSSSATGNQWYFNGTAIAGATGQTYTATQTGDYTCIVTLQGVSSSTSNTISFVTGIKEISSDNSVSVYPNPSNGVFLVKASKISSIEVFNAIGNNVLTVLVNGDKATLDLAKESNGIYFLKVTTDKSVVTEKIVISK